MTRLIRALALMMATLTASELVAQDSWVQIEAQPTLEEASERARAYAGAFPGVQGYRLNSGWYAIVLGPFTPDEAARQLDLLGRERLIPPDSFIATPGSLDRRFWPAGFDATALEPAQPDTAATDAAPESGATEPAFTALPDETIDQALASEAALDDAARLDLQRAMQWFGIYAGKIDGSFGKGTRAAMADWQGQNGHDQTGILTTAQRADLTAAWQGERAALGILTVTEKEAGITIDLPMGLVEFDGYEPPFVRYRAKGNSGYQVLLISRRGDARTLLALYERIQTLELMPMGAEGALTKSGFTLSGGDAGGQAHAQADLSGGFIKGFVLVTPPGKGDQAARALDAMKASFTALPDKGLDETLGEPSLVSAADLTAGLDVRHPALSRSGAFIDATGAVLTTTEVLANCARLTIDRRHEATVAFRDDAHGLAVLRPLTPLAPRAFAGLPARPLRVGADVAIAGYPYEDRLDRPVMSFGTLAEASGLNGETDLARLSIRTRAGDVGAAVLDSTGALAGMLLPPRDGDGRDLPEGTGIVVQADAIAAALAQGGVTLAPGTAAGPLAAEDLARRARDMAVLVSCWR